MKGTVSLIAALFVTAIITGCAEQSGPVETKRERLAAFAESQKLREEIKQCNREIRQLREGMSQPGKKIEQQRIEIAQLTQQVNDLEKQVGETISQSVDKMGTELFEENARLQEKIEQLETQLKACKE